MNNTISYKFNMKIYYKKLIILLLLFSFISYYIINILIRNTLIGIFLLPIPLIVLVSLIFNIIKAIYNKTYLNIKENYIEIHDPNSLTKKIYFSDISSINKTSTFILISTDIDKFRIYNKYIYSDIENNLEELYLHLRSKLKKKPSH